MTQQEEVRKKARRDFLLILLVLPFGILCMFFAGGAAIKLVPFWSLETNMGSKIDPRVDFVFKGTPYVMEQVSADILTPAAWDNLFLTPNAFVPPVVSQPPVAFVPPVNNPPVTEPPPVDVPATGVPPTEPPPSGGGGPPSGGGDPPPTEPPPSGGGPPSTTPSLSIQKDDGSLTYTPGNPIQYTITVSNTGTGSASGATVADIFNTAILSNINWKCASSGGATCQANGIGDINDIVSLPASSSITYTVDADTSSSATAVLENTASVTYKGVTTSAKDSDTANLPVNLSVTKTDNSDVYIPGTSIKYTITVSNAGPGDATGISITDNVPVSVTVVSKSCLPSVVSTNTNCGTDSSTSANNILFANAAIEAGENLSIVIDGTVAVGTSGTLMNTASVTHAGVTISQTDIDGDTTEPDFGNPDGYWANLSAGKDIIFDLGGSGGINYTGSLDSAYDIVYFERYYPSNFNPQDVRLDCVQVQISTSNSSPYTEANGWYTIFFWCSGGPDTNTNVDTNVIGGSETDNRVFSPGSLYGIPVSPFNAPPYNSGVTIDAHAPLFTASAPNGKYRYLRIYSPALGDGDPVNLDSIYLCPAGGC